MAFLRMYVWFEFLSCWLFDDDKLVIIFLLFQQIDRKFIMMLIQSHGLIDYVDAVLLDERASLNNAHIFNFLLTFFPKVNLSNGSCTRECRF